jgi:hypothetical protein
MSKTFAQKATTKVNGKEGTKPLQIAFELMGEEKNSQVGYFVVLVFDCFK